MKLLSKHIPLIKKNNLIHILGHYYNCTECGSLLFVQIHKTFSANLNRARMVFMRAFCIYHQQKICFQGN